MVSSAMTFDPGRTATTRRALNSENLHLRNDHVSGVFVWMVDDIVSIDRNPP